MPQEAVSDQRSDPLGTAVDDVDARISALEKTGQWWPGMIGWTAAATAPQGWLVADGSTFDGDRYAALAAVLGSTTLPNLVDRFPVGAGNLYALLATGGAASVTLSAAESGMPTHTTAGPSTANTGAGTAHTHTNTVGTESATHAHAPSNGGQFVVAGTGSTASIAVGGASYAVGNTTATENATHNHTVTINTEAAHTHSLSSHTHAVTGVAASSAHTNLPPFVALTPLIHI